MTRLIRINEVGGHVFEDVPDELLSELVELADDFRAVVLGHDTADTVPAPPPAQEQP